MCVRERVSCRNISVYASVLYGLISLACMHVCMNSFVFMWRSSDINTESTTKTDGIKLEPARAKTSKIKTEIKPHTWKSSSRCRRRRRHNKTRTNKVHRNAHHRFIIITVIVNNSGDANRRMWAWACVIYTYGLIGLHVSLFGWFGLYMLPLERNFGIENSDDDAMLFDSDSTDQSIWEKATCLSFIQNHREQLVTLQVNGNSNK